ncbi:uncharacterized protein LOC133194369 [Saccostrea echinata]|uniref:uncharacterized protein LOC133194369 n=1 Tax=Saccostrea echinata TaxID=191078 RepID=UPI002A81E5BF|nr:uncharacterized protein LOC133194369 [Saccostrea echinata]
MNTTYWQCTSGCGSAINLDNVNYICTGASVSGNWEQGERTFTYTSPGTGPFKVEFTGRAWVTLSNRPGGSWSIGTIINLKERSDTHKPNTSPITTGKPMYIVQYNCQNDIRIPVADADGDDIRCRWSTGTECASICNALPSATIDTRTCTIKFPSNHTQNGTFAVAVTMEDFPKSTISIGSTVHRPNTPLSSVTLQFLITTPHLSGRCNDKPVFVTPTPSAGSTIQANISQAFHVSFYATDSRRIIKMDITAPAGMTYTSVQSVSSRPGTFFVTTSWTPQQNQVGSHIVCALAEDTFGKTSESRCFNINVNDVSPCVSSPCKNGGTCARQGITQNYRCICSPGYTGHVCETDINECASGPCQNLGTCHDHVNSFTCTCRSGFTGVMCQTDIDECQSDPCQHNGSCTDQVNMFKCSCIPGFTYPICQTDIDECTSFPCQNNGSCIDEINQFRCSCVPGFTGLVCEIDINECASSPCLNLGTCNDLINRFTCSCQPGFTGILCDININECAPDPCSIIFYCEDHVNDYYCRINKWKLAIIICTILLVNLTAISIVIYLSNRRKYRDVDHSWLSSFIEVRKPDTQPRSL